MGFHAVTPRWEFRLFVCPSGLSVELLNVVTWDGRFDGEDDICNSFHDAVSDFKLYSMGGHNEARASHWCGPHNLLKILFRIHWILHTNKCTNCISYISLKLFTLKTLKMLLYVSIAYRVSSSGSTYCSFQKLRVKIMNISLLWAMWQHITYLCVRCFQCRTVCELQSTYRPALETIHDMLPYRS